MPSVCKDCKVEVGDTTGDPNKCRRYYADYCCHNCTTWGPTTGDGNNRWYAKEACEPCKRRLLDGRFKAAAVKSKHFLSEGKNLKALADEMKAELAARTSGAQASPPRIPSTAASPPHTPSTPASPPPRAASALSVAASPPRNPSTAASPPRTPPVAASSPGTSAAVADPSSPGDDLLRLLRQFSLEEAAPQLKFNGVRVAADLEHLEDADIPNLGLALVDQKKLRKLLAASQGQPSSPLPSRLLAVPPKSRPRHCFITHNWGRDKLGRSTHERAKRLNARLGQHGARTWFDEERMEGHIRDQMRKGIDESAVVVVCITATYAEKVLKMTEPDNCQFELSYAMSRKNPRLLLPVVMEPAARSLATWQGDLASLTGTLYRDLTKDDASFEHNVDLLAADIARIVRENDL